MFNKGILTALLIGLTLPAAGCITVYDTPQGGPIYGSSHRGPPPMRRPAPPWWENDPQGPNCKHDEARGSTADSPYCREAYERDARRASQQKRYGY